MKYAATWKILLLLVAGCAAAAEPKAPAQAKAAPANPKYEAALINNVPHLRQERDFCGEACAAMILQHLGKKWDQNDVFNVSGVDPVLGRGCYTQELSPALSRIGFRVGDVGNRVSAAQAEAEMEKQWAVLHADLVHGIASIVCMHYSGDPKTTEHFRLVLGYDPVKDEVIYHEPAEANGAYRRMKRSNFIDWWPLKYDSKLWTVIRMRLEPNHLTNAPAKSGFTPADYAQHIMTLKEKLPSGFSFVVEAPFVVVGDAGAAAVRQSAENTVKFAVTRLKADYFPKDPDHIIDVWLFKDDESYRKGAKKIFGDTPTTPYGYYSSAHNALIMNIATGGGTLVHEIVHPFMRANFPNCPDWLNEGMGSLYEQSADKGGHIVGLTNWRLAGLQKAIESKSVPPFKTLCGTTNSEFYNKDRGTNYAQARYLCYYLQEKGLLVKFYHDFLAGAKDDPTGYKTLQKALGESDMDVFQKKWEEYVMKLVFRT
jgi:hypothetical protein